MRTLLRLEYLALVLLSLVLFAPLPYAWWVYPLLILAPDLGMIGYALGPRVGAATYNATHHLAVAVVCYAMGTLAGLPALALIGVIVLGHSNLDRLLGYGLKFGDSFHHTHLGWIGRGRKEGETAG